jgi:hypothetical protein
VLSNNIVPLTHHPPNHREQGTALTPPDPSPELLRDAYRISMLLFASTAPATVYPQQKPPIFPGKPAKYQTAIGLEPTLYAHCEVTITFAL